MTETTELPYWLTPAHLAGYSRGELRRRAAMSQFFAGQTARSKEDREKFAVEAAAYEDASRHVS